MNTYLSRTQMEKLNTRRLKSYLRSLYHRNTGYACDISERYAEDNRKREETQRTAKEILSTREHIG